MAKVVSIGAQYFDKLREKGAFYVDKTYFIKEWWEREDDVTLITRPRRFGKTLNMSMTECFFSNKYSGRGDLFEGLSIWEDKKYRELQGTYPVIFLSFAGVKGGDFEITKGTINELITDIYGKNEVLFKTDDVNEKDKEFYHSVNKNMPESVAHRAINRLCSRMHDYYGKKCIVIIDEYDTPMQEAWINGYWDELTAYIRGIFNNTFKTNPYLERGLMTGITRVSKESVFSDLNNLNVVTTTSDEYADCFGFTEEEVFKAMDDQGIDPSEKAEVKKWYDGFTFGSIRDIYNPWSVTSYLDKKKMGLYWANTSGNGLINKLLREGDTDIKMKLERLMKGEPLRTELDEQIVFSQLGESRNAIWSLLLASGYLKVDKYEEIPEDDGQITFMYTLSITNLEVKAMFSKLIKDWFSRSPVFNDFILAMLKGDIKAMNWYMNQVALSTFSYFDAGNRPSGKEPERFYHGFVLGLMVDKANDYIVKSNRESGFGRYDVVMEPKDSSDVAVIMEFKVYDEEDEATLSDTADSALRQIEEKRYDTELINRGIPEEHIYKYGFAFEGEKCLIKKG